MIRQQVMLVMLHALTHSTISRQHRRSTKSERQEAKERRNGTSTFRPGVRSEVEWQTRRDNDFDLPRTGNKNKANKM